MANLYLRGSKSRGRDVKKALVDLGGKLMDGDSEAYNDESLYYFINSSGYIYWEEKDKIDKVVEILGLFNDSIYISDFDKFEGSELHYRIGDNVVLKEGYYGISGSPRGIVTGMKWSRESNSVKLIVDFLPNKLISWESLEKDTSKDLSFKYKKEDCFANWDSHQEILYLMKIKFIDFKTGNATLFYIEVDTTEEYDNKITLDEIKFDNLSVLTGHLNLIKKEYGWKKIDDGGEFLRFPELKRELNDLVKIVKSKAIKK